MAAKARYRRRKSAVEILLRTLLWLVLIPVILAAVTAVAAFCYLTLSGFAYDTADDIAIIAAEAPMDAAERLAAVDAAEGTFTVAVNKSDVYWVATRENLLRPLAYDAEDALEEFHFELDKYAVQIEGGHLYVTARLLYRHFLYVPVRIELTPAAEDGTLVFYLKEIYIGELLRLPLERFSGANEPVYTLKERLHPRMDSLRSVAVKGEHLLLTFGLDAKDDLCRELLSMDRPGLVRCRYLDCDAARIRQGWAFDPGVQGTAIQRALSQCEATPARLVDLKLRVLAVGTYQAQESFFRSRDADYQARFFPGGTEADANALRAVYDGEASVREAAVEAVVRRLDEAYAARRITIGPGQVYLDEAPITAEALMADAWASYADWLDGDAMRYVLLDELLERPAGYLPKTEGLPVLSRVLTEKGAAGKIGTNKKVPLGIVFLLPSGARTMQYLSDTGLVQQESVSDVLFDAAVPPGETAHWPAGDPEALALLLPAATEQGLTSLAEADALTVSGDATRLVDPSFAATFAETVLRFAPNLQALDLAGAGALPADARAVLSAMLPTVELAFAEEAPAADAA